MQRRVSPEDLAPHRIQPAADPPQTTDTVRVSKIVPLGVDSSISEYGITVAKLFEWVQGKQDYYKRVRVDKVCAWCEATPGGSIKLNLPQDETWDGADLQLFDSGVAGSSRAKVGYVPGLLQRARWFRPSDATSFGTVFTPSGTAGIVHVSCTFST
jgi:hypothetical protein